MKHFFLFSLIIILFTLSACLSEEGNKPTEVSLAEMSTQEVEAEVFERVRNVDMVKSYQKTLDEKTKGIITLELSTIHPSSDTVNFYKVDVSEQFQGKFRSIGVFHVYPQEDWTIRFYDVLSKKEIDLDSIGTSTGK